MLLGRVVGNVVSSVKVKAHKGYKLLLVRPERADGTLEAHSYVAIDLVQAGEGDRVLLLREGSSVRDMIGATAAPVHAAVVGIVDEVAKQ
jgi:ethanolamine utilization protein EutN